MVLRPEKDPSGLNIRLGDEATSAVATLSEQGKDVEEIVQDALIAAARTSSTPPQIIDLIRRFESESLPSELRRVDWDRNNMLVHITHPNYEYLFEVEVNTGMARIVEKMTGREAECEFLTQEQTGQCLIHSLMSGPYADWQKRLYVE